jgi:hypothetical protein
MLDDRIEGFLDGEVPRGVSLPNRFGSLALLIFFGGVVKTL